MSDQVAPPRLLLRLEAEIANAPTQLEADCKRAERAAYLARSSEPSEALAVVTSLQKKYAPHPNGRISAWAHLVMGLVDHATCLDPKARERILRAHALSRAAGLTRERALSAAWLAHMDYSRQIPESMSSYAAEALSLAAAEDHSTRSRACLVVAQAYHFADRIDLSMPWYTRARNHASAEGDGATLSALMHNMAWLRTQQLRFKSWNDGPVAIDLEHALLGAQSVASYDAAIGVTALNSLVPLLRAHALVATGAFLDALALYESHLHRAIDDGLVYLYADFLADQAWCRANLEQFDAALLDAQTAEERIDPNGQFDDRTMAHARLAQVFRVLGLNAKADLHEFEAQKAFQGHEKLRRETLEALNSYPELALG